MSPKPENRRQSGKDLENPYRAEVQGLERARAWIAEQWERSALGGK
jgi:hypothetical protein